MITARTPAGAGALLLAVVAALASPAAASPAAASRVAAAAALAHAALTSASMSPAVPASGPAGLRPAGDVPGGVRVVALGEGVFLLDMGCRTAQGDPVVVGVYARRAGSLWDPVERRPGGGRGFVLHGPPNFDWAGRLALTPTGARARIGLVRWCDVRFPTAWAV